MPSHTHFGSRWDNTTAVHNHYYSPRIVQKYQSMQAKQCTESSKTINNELSLTELQTEILFTSLFWYFSYHHTSYTAAYIGILLKREYCCLLPCMHILSNVCGFMFYSSFVGHHVTTNYVTSCILKTSSGNKNFFQALYRSNFSRVHSSLKWNHKISKWVYLLTFWCMAAIVCARACCGVTLQVKTRHIVNIITMPRLHFGKCKTEEKHSISLKCTPDV